MSQFRQLHEGGIEGQPEAGGQIVWTVTDRQHAAQAGADGGAGDAER